MHSPVMAKQHRSSSFARPARTSSRAALAESMPRHFLDDALLPNVNWVSLAEDMRRVVEDYRIVVDNQQKSDIVRSVEDISDHLRLLLAAASGTTDQHSGYPSIIASNKALYPHFRNMMARFSKLVLSSHMAAADFSNNDSLGKCMQEADGILTAINSFIEVARQQRGEEIPRLTPGFLARTPNGGSWQNNGLASNTSLNLSSAQDGGIDDVLEPSVQLSAQVLERLSDLRRAIVSSLRRLEEKLALKDKIISTQKHKRFSNELCQASGKAIDQCRSFMSTMESINLSWTGMTLIDPMVVDFASHKTLVYACAGELVMSSQAVAAPLGDEWESHRGDTLEDRLERVRGVSRSLERATAEVQHCLQSFLSTSTAPSLHAQTGISNGYTNGSENYSHSNKKESTINFSHHKTMSSAASSTVVPTISSASASSRASIQAPTSTIPSDAEGMLLNAGSSKANKFFGEAPVIRYADMPSAALEDMPAFLGLDYEGEIQYDTKTDPPSIKGGTLLGLVEQLTRHDKFDSLFKTSFLLTYQSFTSANELFEVLIRRWSIQPPPGLSQDDIKMWMEKKQAPIRLRIVNVLKQWVELYWMEGNDNASQELISRMYNFAKDTVAQSNTPGWKPLLNVIEQRSRGEDTSAKKLVQTPTTQTPLPILPKNMKKLKFTDIDPTEFARQLTIIESRLYAKIKPHECLNKIWQKRPPAENGVQAEPAANVKALILHSNRLTNFVAEMILNVPDLTKRANIVKHFIAVADKCLALNNFSTLTAIISALGTSPIHRLARTWNKIGKSTAATLEKMRKLMHSTKNFAPYRQALHQSNPPCIPFFGVYLTDLTFIEDGMASVIKKTDLINFAKRAKTAEVIREIQTYQNVGYPFKAVPELQDYILSMLQSAGDVHEMYDQSLKVEPREREDEKIARSVIFIALSHLKSAASPSCLRSANMESLQTVVRVRLPLNMADGAFYA